MNLFRGVSPVPADEVVGITEAASRDPNPATVDLSIGGYRDADGRVPILPSVAAALADFVAAGEGRGYGSLLGPAPFHRAVADLVFDGDPPPATVVAQAVGGTGALRLLLETWCGIRPTTTVWVTDPAYPNHPKVASAAGARVALYDHAAAAEGIDLGGPLDALDRALAGDVLLVHGCCHNPTGVDPTPEQWATLARAARERLVLPVIDLAYLGFGGTFDEDTAAVRAFREARAPFAVCVSFSKNFVLAGERVGALVLCLGEDDVVEPVRSRLALAARSLWSGPPRFGAELVTAVLSSPASRAQWQAEVREGAERIRDVRRRLAHLLDELGCGADTAGLVRQRGLFWWSGLSQPAVRRLREEHSVYVLDSGRVNLAAIPAHAFDDVAKAFSVVSR